MIKRIFETPYLALLATLTLLWVCVMPSENIPDDVDDKTAHFLSFGLLACLWFWVYPQKWLPVALGVSLFGVMIEFIQGALPQSFHRGFELGDMWADAIGAAIGVALGWVAKAILTNFKRSKEP